MTSREKWVSFFGCYFPLMSRYLLGYWVTFQSACMAPVGHHEVLRRMFLREKVHPLAREEQRRPQLSSSSDSTLLRKSSAGQSGARRIAATDPFHMPIIIWSIANLKSCPKAALSKPNPWPSSDGGVKSCSSNQHSWHQTPQWPHTPAFSGVWCSGISLPWLDGIWQTQLN